MSCKFVDYFLSYVDERVGPHYVTRKKISTKTDVRIGEYNEDEKDWKSEKLKYKEQMLDLNQQAKLFEEMMLKYFENQDKLAALYD